MMKNSKEKPIADESPPHVDALIPSKVTSICSVALIPVLGILTSFAVSVGLELSLFANRDSLTVSDLTQFDSFSEADIDREIRKAECRKFLILFGDEFGEFWDREIRYFGQYKNWVQQRGQDDSIEASRMYQRKIGQPPVFDCNRWIPLIEAKLQEFDGTADGMRLKAALSALQKRRDR